MPSSIMPPLPSFRDPLSPSTRNAEIEAPATIRQLSPRRLRAILDSLYQVEGQLDIDRSEEDFNGAEQDPRDATLERIAHIREELQLVFASVQNDIASSEDCRIIVGVLDHLREHVEALENTLPVGEHPAHSGNPAKPSENLLRVMEHLDGLNDVKHRLEADRIEDLRSSKRWKKGALKVTATASGLIGVSLMGAGAAMGVVGFAGLASAFGSATAVGMLVGAGAAESLGLALAGGSGAAVFAHQKIDPSSKRFIRKYHPEQMESTTVELDGLRMNMDFDQRRKRVKSWAKNHKVKVGREEEYWYAGKDNFQRFLQLSKIDGSKEHRHDIKTLMQLERKHSLWGCDCPSCDE